MAHSQIRWVKFGYHPSNLSIHIKLLLHLTQSTLNAVRPFYYFSFELDASFGRGYHNFILVKQIKFCSTKKVVLKQVIHEYMWINTASEQIRLNELHYLSFYLLKYFTCLYFSLFQIKIYTLCLVVLYI